MGVVEPLRPPGVQRHSVRDPGDVVRRVEFLGPVSPELALVDPELAERARALLPETPGPRLESRESDRPIALRLVSPPVQRRPAPWARTTISRVVAVVAISAFALGWTMATNASEDEPALRSLPPRPAGSPTVPRSPAAPPAKPSQPSRLLEPPRFVWPADPDADGYRVALFRGSRKVFERDVKESALQLPPSWTFDGRLQSLRRGTYRWVVWPYSGAAKRLGSAIVSAQYTV